jgi:hypothetical protein
MSIHEDHVNEDGTLDDTAVETQYCPLEYISVPVPFRPYFRIVGDDGPCNVEIRLPFEALTQNGWKTKEEHQAALDAVLTEAAWAMQIAKDAMECGVAREDLTYDKDFQRAQAFLIRPDVLALRRGEE